MSPSPETSNAEELLRAHLDLCDRVQKVLMDENRHLRSTRSLPTEALLSSKQELLPALDASLERLRELNAQGTRLGPNASHLLQTAQKRLLKLLLLDRENETLLLEAGLSVHKPTPARAQRVLPGRLHQAYTKRP